MSTGRIIPVVPGLLVALRTSIKGGVHFRREDLVDEVEGLGTRSEWKTEKRIDDAQEYTQARRLRSRIVTLIGGACIKTRFTYICPMDKEQTLNERIAEAQEACDAFNMEAVYSHVSFDLMRGRYTEDTRETIQAVRREIQELMGELSTALSEGKVEGIRDVAARATNMGRLLEEGSEARNALERAIKESRRVARQIVKRVEEGADAVAEVLAGANVSLIATARHVFQEDEMGEITDAVPSMPSTALGRFGDLGQDYVEPPAPEPATDVPPPSPGLEAGAALGAMLTDALVAFGEYSFADRGPHEVMDMGAAVALVRDLEPADILAALGMIQDQHGDLGGVLVDAITEELNEETMERLDALSGEDADSQEEAEAPGVVVPLANAAQILANPGATGNAQAGPAAFNALQIAVATGMLAGIVEMEPAGDVGAPEPATEAEVVPGPDDFDDDALGEI